MSIEVSTRSVTEKIPNKQDQKKVHKLDKD